MRYVAEIMYLIRLDLCVSDFSFLFFLHIYRLRYEDAF